MPAKLTLQQARQIYIDKGATPLFTEYHGVEYKYPFICCNNGCENIHSMTLNQVRNRGDTPQCKLHSKKGPYRLSLEEDIKPYFKKYGLILITKKYINNTQKLEFICKCWKIGKITWAKCVSQNQIPRCKECQFKYSYPRGSESKHWKQNLSNSDREINRHRPGDKVWQNSVKRRDNYTCQLCGTKESKENPLSAHHLYNYADYPDKRTDPNNGVCICCDHHIEFHSKEFYGKGNNTPEQFFEYAFKFKEAE